VYGSLKVVISIASCTENGREVLSPGSAQCKKLILTTTNTMASERIFILLPTGMANLE
jgi:hypothetical protein